MTDMPAEITTKVEDNSVIDWFTANVNRLPFEGRSAIVDIAQMIVNAANGEQTSSSGRRQFPPVFEQELVAPEYCDIDRDTVEVLYWDPDFAGYSRVLSNIAYVATTLAAELGSRLLTAAALPAPVGAEIIGDRLYDTCNNFWLPIPENALGFDHPRALFHVFPGDMMSQPDFEVVVAHDESSDSARQARARAAKIHETLVERALRENPYRNTAHTVSVGRGGIFPTEVLNLSHETRATLFLDDHIWKNMDDQMKIFGETGDRLEKANIRTSRGVLLQGWPGCGKTKMVRVYANELSKQGITVIMADTVAARHVQEIIDYAKTFDKAVVVLEDIDSVVGARGASSLSAFLNAMDGVSQQNRIVTIATTNDGTALDPAVVRPGRIDTVIDVSTLNKQAITALIDGMSQKAGYDIDSGRVAAAVLDRTKSVTGAMLEGLILNAMLTDDKLETDELIAFVKSGWVISDPRRNYLDVYRDEDDEDDEF